MRLSISEPEEIKLNMTAMIDIVFQLLVFFIMTFKVVAMEGDFNVKMPIATTNQVESLDDVLPDIIAVNLVAGTNGNINRIVVDGDISFDSPEMFKDLTRLVESRLAADGDVNNPVETEVEFEISYGLKYQYTVQAIEAVSGKVDGDGVTKLIKTVKFKDSKKGS